MGSDTLNWSINLLQYYYRLNGVDCMAFNAGHALVVTLNGLGVVLRHPVSRSLSRGLPLSRLLFLEPGKDPKAIDVFQKNCNFVIAHNLLNRMM